MEHKLLNQEILRQIREIFTQLKQPVQVLYFGKQTGCEYCAETLQLTQEVTAISDKLSLSVYDLEKDARLAEQYNVDKAPALVLTGKDGDQVVDYGIRFAGIPSGHEFGSLIHSLILVSGRDSGLNPQTRQMLSALKKPVHLQVFVTPT